MQEWLCEEPGTGVVAVCGFPLPVAGPRLVGNTQHDLARRGIALVAVAAATG